MIRQAVQAVGWGAQRGTDTGHRAGRSMEQLEPRALFAGSGLAAAYFNDTNLYDTRAGRVDARVLFDFNSEPVAGVGNNFSARWTGRVEPRYSETYRFIVRTAGGVRLWVDNRLLVDDWTASPLRNVSGQIALNAGKRVNIRLEYQTPDVPGSVRLYWESARQVKEVIPAKFLYASAAETSAPGKPASLKGTYATDTTLAFKWSPVTDDSGFVAYDIYLNGAKVATTTDTSYTSTGRSPNSANTFVVRAVDSFGNTRPSKSLFMQSAPAVASAGGTGLAASYYSGTGFNQFRMTRTDAQVNFNWNSAPVTTDDGTFTVRWRGRVQAKYSELYTFYTTSDDAVRLWVNGSLIIDHWNDHASAEDKGTILLSAGQRYDVRMDYRQTGGEAVASLAWSSLSQAKQTVAAGQLFPAFVDSAAPSTPASVSIEDVTGTAISVDWNASSDDVGVAAYDVYRNGAKVSTVTDSTFTDTGLSYSTQYSYQVVAVDGAGRASGNSNSATVTTEPSPAIRNAFTEFSASAFDQGLNVTNSGGSLGDFDAGEWVRYNGVDFGSGNNVRSLRLKLGVPSNSVGGSIEVRADGVSGTLLGTVVVQQTGSYGTYYWQQTASGSITGIHDIYLVAKNRSDVANVQSIQFMTKSLTKVMALGDSITHGFNNYASYRYYLWQQLQGAGKGVDFVGSMTNPINGYPPNMDFDQNHEGHAGWTADQIANNIVGWAQSAQPDVVLLHIGTNDLRGGDNPSNTINDIGLIIDRLRQVNSNVKVLLARIIPCGDAPAGSVDAFNAMIPGLAASKNTGQSPVQVVDTNTGFTLPGDTFDNLHLNTAGEQKMAQRFFDALVPLV